MSCESYKFTLYYVAAFLCYISNVHSLYQNLKMQQILFNSLIEEKQDDENHLELRQCFAERFGVTWPDLYGSRQIFTIHTATDEWHTDKYANFIVDLNKEKQEKVVQGTKKGIKLLYYFWWSLRECRRE